MLVGGVDAMDDNEHKIIGTASGRVWTFQHTQTTKLNEFTIFVNPPKPTHGAETTGRDYFRWLMKPVLDVRRLTVERILYSSLRQTETHWFVRCSFLLRNMLMPFCPS